MKLAAIEGLGQTTTGAPEHLLGWYDGDKVVYGIEIPRLLSLLAFHDPNATVTGLDSVPPADRPPVNVVRFAFQTMVGIGTLLALLERWSTSTSASAGKRLPRSRWFYRAVVARRPALGGRADRRLGHDRGRPPAVGRLRRACAPPRRSPAREGIPVGYATLVARLRRAGRRGRWLLRRLSRAPLRGRDAPARRDGRRPMLADVPIVLILVGLAAYTVLAGADFGAGFWTLVPGGGRASRRRRARPRAPRDGAGLGGQPRLADLRPRRLLDRLPGRLRARSPPRSRCRCSSPRSGSSCAAPRTRCAASSRRRAEQRAIERVFALSSVLTPFALGTVVGAIASGRVPVGNAAGDLCHELAQPDVDR